MHVERVRNYLMGKGRGVGYFLGAGFGAITPFCSCSSIPLFLGFTTARIPLGITMSFLITSPLINEIARGAAVGAFGMEVHNHLCGSRYSCGHYWRGVHGRNPCGTLAATFPFGGYEECSSSGYGHTTGASTQNRAYGTPYFCLLRDKQHFPAASAVVIVGVGLGALLHGFVPQEWFTENLGAGQWWSVPLAVAVGIPLYTNVTGIIPVMESLLLKGLPLGTTLAFCMSTVAASLPEVLMLQAGHELEAAGGISWHVIDYIYACRLVI